jgi:outer membrane biosynthesis protein TonB
MISLPQDMRRTALISAGAHLFLLLALTMVPFMKMATRTPAAYQVTLVSPSTLRASLPSAQTRPVPPKASIEPLKTPSPQPTASVRAVEPPQPAPLKTQPPLADLLRQNMRDVALPKEVSPAPQKSTAKRPTDPTESLQSFTPLNEYRRPSVAPVVPMDSSPPRPSTMPLPSPESAPPKSAAERNLLETLRKAEEALNKPTAPAPPPTMTASPKPAPRSKEEIIRELNRLAVPQAVKPPAPQEAERPEPARPSFSEEVSRLFTSAPRNVVPQTKEGASEPERTATLERCPPRAQQYCPLLEAAINRAWNADTNPDTRKLFEAAKNSVVTVRIVVEPNGEIREITLKDRSGNEAYDIAVQSLLRGLRAPPLPEEMRKEPFVAYTSFKYTKRT